MPTRRRRNCRFDAPTALAALLIAGLSFAAPAEAGPIFDDPSLRDVLEIRRDDAPGIEDLRKAVAAFREGRLNDALAAFEAAAKTNPDLPPSRLMLARLLFAAGDAARGRALLEQVAAAAPERADVYLLFGQLALAEGRVSDAALNFEKSASLGGTSLSEKDAARLDAGNAAVAEARGNWQAAEAALAAWLKREPDSGDARLRLARSLVRQGKPDDAYAALKEGEAARGSGEASGGSAPVPPAAVVGRLLEEAGKRDDARPWMERALKEHPKDPAAHAAVAGWHLDIGEPDAARKQLAAAEELDPDLAGLGRLRGLAALQLRDYPTAEKEFETLYRASPSDAAAADGLARALAGQEDEAKRRRAAELAEINARQYPNDPQALATLGRTYLALGRHEQAEQLLSAAVSNGRTTSETVYDLARTLAFRGRTAEARSLVEQALTADGPFPQRDEAAAWLTTLPGPATDAAPRVER